MVSKVKSCHVWALDIHQHKVELIQKNALRSGFSAQVTAQKLDARLAGKKFSNNRFDQILLDAPCSGIGLLRRKPEIRYRKKTTDIESLSQIQENLLESMVPLVKPHGKITYSTCTLMQEENQQVIKKFLKKHPEFVLSDQNQLGRTIFPDEFGSDGFFMVNLIKSGI